MFYFKVVPFQFITSAVSCNKMIKLLLNGLTNVDRYVDDILAYGNEAKVNW